jgi:hypothetical protein
MVYYRVPNTPPLDPTVRQPNPIHKNKKCSSRSILISYVCLGGWLNGGGDQWHIQHTWKLETHQDFDRTEKNFFTSSRTKEMKQYRNHCVFRGENKVTVVCTT